MTVAETPRFAAFDLVELTEDVAEHGRGALGTVVVSAQDHALIDFAWSPREADCATVPERCLRLVQRHRPSVSGL